MIVKKISAVLIVFVALEFILFSVEVTSSLSSPRSSPKEKRQLFFRGQSSSKVLIIEDEDQQDKGSSIKSNDRNVALSAASTLYSSSTFLDSPSSPFIEWLDDQSASNPSILGVERKDIKQISENAFRCIQPSISWFGIDLVPSFVNQVSRRSSSISPPSTTIVASTNSYRNDVGHAENNNMDDYDYEYIINVHVKESKIELGPKSKDKKGKSTIKNLMNACDFDAVNVIKCRRRSDTFQKSDGDISAYNGGSNRSRVWDVSSDFSLKVTVPLPKSKFLLLPPGFNAIGSRIIQRTCRSRSEAALQQFKDDFLNWSSSRSDTNK